MISIELAESEHGCRGLERVVGEGGWGGMANWEYFGQGEHGQTVLKSGWGQILTLLPDSLLLIILLKCGFYNILAWNTSVTYHFF